MNKLSLAFIIGAGGLAASCTPYSPDLDPTPFLCGDADPKCPEGYECVEDTALMPSRFVCVAPGGLIPDADTGGGFQCADDGSLEPNDNPQENAFQTDVGTAMMRAFGPISICPEGDKDHFAVTISTGDVGLEAVTTWESGMPIHVAILQENAISIANGTMIAPKSHRACAANLPIGQYYVSAFSGGIKNNYRIQLKIVPNCVP
jgi:hypothetical protein